MKRSQRLWARLRAHTALKVVLIYTAVSGLWILLSDQLVMLLTADHALLLSLNTFKGWGFVALTAFLLYRLIEADLAVQRRTEQALRQWADAFENCAHGIAMDDPVSNTLLTCNTAFARLHGRPAHQIQGLAILSLYAPADHEQVRASMAQADRDGQCCYEARMVRYDGSTYAVQMDVVSVRDEAGRLLYRVTTQQDITARKQAEAELAQLNAELEQRIAQRTAQLAAANERLTELDRLKSKFVSDVTHELRTPVTSVSLYIDLLEHGKPERHAQYMHKLQAQMARLHDLINDILDMSRLERDRAETERSVVDLNSIVEHVCAMERGTAEAAGLVLNYDIAAELPPVLAHPDQISRAITNLVSNAIKYTPQGGVRVKAFARDARVCVEVSDTGLGIPADELPHLFSRFYRGKQVAQSGIPGTGLGLSLVKEIVEAHAGTVEVESRVAVGSTFRVWLPALPDSAR